MPDYFALGDTNKDGHIDYEEFHGMAETFDLPVETMKVNRMCLPSFRILFPFVCWHWYTGHPTPHLSSSPDSMLSN